MKLVIRRADLKWNEQLNLALRALPVSNRCYEPDEAGIRAIAESLGIPSSGDILAVAAGLHTKGIEVFRELPKASAPEKTVIPIPEGWVGENGHLTPAVGSVEDFLREAIEEEIYTARLESIQENYKDIRPEVGEIAIVSWNTTSVGSHHPISQFEVEYLEF